MKAELEFNPKRRCPKCHGKHVAAHYYPKATEWDWERTSECWPKREFIRRGCKQCGYEWAEFCKGKSNAA